MTNLQNLIQLNSLFHKIVFREIKKWDEMVLLFS